MLHILNYMNQCPVTTYRSDTMVKEMWYLIITIIPITYPVIIIL